LKDTGTFSLGIDAPDQVKAGDMVNFSATYVNNWTKSYKFKLKVWINGDLYDTKTKYLTSGELMMVSGSYTQPESGSTIHAKDKMYWHGWVDDCDKKADVAVPQPQHCDKSDLAVNWSDKTYTNPDCGLPEGYVAVKTLYSKGPIRINRTDRSTDRPAPEVPCDKQWKQWKNGYMRTAEKCPKDNLWYWVDYPAKLIPAKGNIQDMDYPSRALPGENITISTEVGNPMQGFAVYTLNLVDRDTGNVVESVGPFGARRGTTITKDMTVQMPNKKWNLEMHLLFTKSGSSQAEEVDKEEMEVSK